MSDIRGDKVLSGTWAEIWMDGVKLAEASKIEVKVSANREDIQLGLDVDSKITGLKGELTLTLKKVYSRTADILASWQQGKDKRVQIIAKLADPDAVGRQIERYAVNNVWFNDLTPFGAEKGGIIEDELSGGFTPTDMVCLDRIRY